MTWRSRPGGRPPSCSSSSRRAGGRSCSKGSIGCITETTRPSGRSRPACRCSFPCATHRGLRVAAPSPACAAARRLVPCRAYRHQQDGVHGARAVAGRAAAGAGGGPAEHLVQGRARRRRRSRARCASPSYSWPPSIALIPSRRRSSASTGSSGGLAPMGWRARTARRTCCSSSRASRGSACRHWRPSTAASRRGHALRRPRGLRPARGERHRGRLRRPARDDRVARPPRGRPRAAGPAVCGALATAARWPDGPPRRGGSPDALLRDGSGGVALLEGRTHPPRSSACGRCAAAGAELGRRRVDEPGGSS